MKDPKTTILGILTIAGTIITAAVSYLKTGTVPDAGPLLTALSAGFGLITAKDSQSAPLATQQGITAAKLPVLFFLLVPALALSGCAVQQWAASSKGKAEINSVVAAANLYASVSGDPKALAAIGAAGLAVRSLESGELPDAGDVEDAVKSITGNSGLASALGGAVSLAAASAPTVNAGLELVASALDRAATPAKP